MTGKPMKRGGSRVFLIENRAGAFNTPELLENAVAGSLERTFGDVTSIEVPSTEQRGKWDEVGEVVGADERPTVPLTVKRMLSVSRLFELAQIGCAFDVQIHMGACKNPSDFRNGWSDGLVWILESARITGITTEELGAMMQEDDDSINEEGTISAREYYEVVPLTYSEKAANEVAQEIIAIQVCDLVSCGDCDDPSNGCKRVFAVSAPAGSSPGLLPEVVYTDDGFVTSPGETTIDTLDIGEDPDDLTCSGEYLIIVSEDSVSHHYANKDDILAGTETWAEITSGYVASKGPRAVDSSSPTHIWLLGAGGYIYFTDDPTASTVTVQDAGALTTEDFNDVYAFDNENVVGVGDNNAVVYTTDGENWASVTGPSVGVNLNAVLMVKEKEWLVGDAGGQLWHTDDRGSTWTERTFPGSGSGSVEDLVAASDSVFYMSHTTSGTVARILRSISGGFYWNAEPQTGSGSMPAADRFNGLAVCWREPNVVFAGGLGDDAADGIIVKGTK